MQGGSLRSSPFQTWMQQRKVLYDHKLYWKETTVRAHISQQKSSEQHNVCHSNNDSMYSQLFDSFGCECTLPTL